MSRSQFPATNKLNKGSSLEKYINNLLEGRRTLISELKKEISERERMGGKNNNSRFFKISKIETLKKLLKEQEEILSLSQTYLRRVDSLDKLCEEIEEVSSELPREVEELMPMIHKTIPSLKNAAVFLMPRDSFWVKHFFRKGENINATVVNLKDNSGQSRSIILILEDPKNEDGEFDWTSILKEVLGKNTNEATIDQYVDTIIHEGIHLGQQTTKNSLERAIKEGYTTIIEKRIFLSIFHRNPSINIPPYIPEIKLVLELIKHVGERKICDDIYIYGDLTTLKKILGKKIDFLKALVDQVSNKDQWQPIVKDILEGKFDSMDQTQFLGILNQRLE